MTLLTYKDKYVVQSATNISDSTGAYVDDTYASQTFSLSASQTVLVIYNPTLVAAPDTTSRFFYSRINVDTTGYAEGISRVGSDTGNYNRNTTFWVGTLASGSHTIKGQFHCDGTTTVTIDDRILLIYIFDGTEFQYVDNNTAQTTTSSTFVDDTNASVTFTPSGNCKALYLYSACNNDAATDAVQGKKIAISVAGTDYSRADRGMSSSNRPNSLATCYAGTLTAVSTTVKGRIASADGTTITINHRQLGVLLLADTTLLDIVTSDTNVTTTSNTLVDDTQASISRTTTDNRELLVIAVGIKYDLTASDAFGERYGIMTDTVDRVATRLSVGTSNNHGTCNMTCWAESTTAAAHTVKGRFSNNSGTTTADIDSRRVIALWFATNVQYNKSISIVETPTPSVSKIIYRLYTKTIAITETPVPTLIKDIYRFYTKNYTVIETPTPTLSKIIARLQTKTIVETPIATRQKSISVIKSIISTPISSIQLYNPSDPFQLRTRPNDFYRGDTVRIKAILKDRNDNLIQLNPNVAYDYSGNHNNGTIYGAIEKAGKLGIALQYDGIDDHVDIPHSPSLVMTNQLTIAAWVYKIADVNWQRIVAKGDWPNEDYAIIFDNSGKAYGYISVGGIYYYTPTSSVLNLNTWYRLIMTYGGSTLRFYVNGVEQGSGYVYVGNIDNRSTILHIGNTYSKMLIDEPIIVNTKWEQTDITNDWNSGNGKIYKPPELSGLVGYWRFGSIVCQILDHNNVEKSSGVMTKESIGVYTYNYVPGIFEPTGKWIAKVISTDYSGTNIEEYPFYVLQP